MQVNWVFFVQAMVPQWMRHRRLIAWLLVCIGPVRQLHASFLSYRRAALYELNTTGQTIYMERALNDRFDFLGRNIYIETVDDPTQVYLYNQVEDQPKRYLYNRYNFVVAYQAGQFAVYGGYVWKAETTGFLGTPTLGNPQWSVHGPRTFFLRNRIEGLTSYDFIVWIPVDLVYDEAELRALIERYKLAGKRYILQTYVP